MQAYNERYDIKIKDIKFMGYLDWFFLDIERVQDDIANGYEVSHYELMMVEHYRMIFGACNKYKSQLENKEDMSDLIQEGLIILAETIDKYKPIVSGVAVKFSSYLYIRLKGYLQAEFNKKFRSIKLNQNSFSDGTAIFIDNNVKEDTYLRTIEDSVVAINVNSLTKDIIEMLPVSDQKLFIASFIHNYSNVEIANELGITKQAVGKRVKKLVTTIKESEDICTK